MRSPKDTFITVYGRMPVLEVLQDAGLDVDKIVVAHGGHGDSLDRILDLARRRGVPVERATAQRVKLLAGNGKHDQGIIADVVAPRMRGIAEFVTETPERASVLVLDGVNNPSNVGMIIRTATGAGMTAIVLPHVGSPGVDPLVVKASAGVAYRAAIVRARTGASAVESLREAGYTVYGLSGDAPRGLYASEFAPRAAFVLGNETEGLSRETSALVDEWVSIPLEGGVESLNVASAAAVLCYDLVRRRGGARVAPPEPKAERPQPGRTRSGGGPAAVVGRRPRAR
ncbi:RNA methyltransferase [Actinorhabdospora filicis]|uniref:RNA methyltransferase n=1 Tax=Actinorhabdospora filicis TaxID=1785913 RepID=A0A9W6SN05_9ACTN|nr:RNA methyltransferase [Actinorhabdospora filicis]GLZ77561.1 RNA methyltransferase [Actinorhabdospora filicis]